MKTDKPKKPKKPAVKNGTPKKPKDMPIDEDVKIDYSKRGMEYALGGWEMVGHAVPSVVGLCSILNMRRATIYDLANKDEHDFKNILQVINEQQELVTFNRALRGEYNAAIAKLLLGKHGYHDKVDSTNNNVNVNLSDLSDDELMRRLKELQNKT